MGTGHIVKTFRVLAHQTSGMRACTRGGSPLVGGAADKADGLQQKKVRQLSLGHFQREERKCQGSQVGRGGASTARSSSAPVDRMQVFIGLESCGKRKSGRSPAAGESRQGSAGARDRAVERRISDLERLTGRQTRNWVFRRSIAQRQASIERMCELGKVSRAGFCRNWQERQPKEAEVAHRNVIQKRPSRVGPAATAVSYRLCNAPASPWARAPVRRISEAGITPITAYEYLPIHKVLPSAPGSTRKYRRQ